MCYADMLCAVVCCSLLLVGWLVGWLVVGCSVGIGCSRGANPRGSAHRRMCKNHVRSMLYALLFMPSLILMNVCCVWCADGYVQFLESERDPTFVMTQPKYLSLKLAGVTPQLIDLRSTPNAPAAATSASDSTSADSKDSKRP